MCTFAMLARNGLLEDATRQDFDVASGKRLQKTMEITIVNGKTRYTWPFSIAM